MRNPRKEKTGLLITGSSKEAGKAPTFQNSRTVHQRPAFSLEIKSKATYEGDLEGSVPKGEAF